ATFRKNDSPTHDLRCDLSWQIMMKSKEARLDSVPRQPMSEQRIGRFVLRGKQQCHVKAVTLLGRPHDFLDGKVLDPHDLKGMRDVSQKSTADFIRCRPSREHPRPRVL